MYSRSGQLDCPTRHATFHIHLPKQQGPRCLKGKLEYLYMYLYFFISREIKLMMMMMMILKGKISRFFNALIVVCQGYNSDALRSLYEPCRICSSGMTCILGASSKSESLLSSCTSSNVHVCCLFSSQRAASMAVFLTSQ